VTVDVRVEVMVSVGLTPWVAVADELKVAFTVSPKLRP